MREFGSCLPRFLYLPSLAPWGPFFFFPASVEVGAVEVRSFLHDRPHSYRQA